MSPIVQSSDCLHPSCSCIELATYVSVFALASFNLLTFGCLFAAVSVIFKPTRHPFAIFGQYITYSCKVEDIGEGVTVEEIRWYHNQTEITTDIVQQNPDKFIIFSNLMSNYITIKNVTRQDGGKYYCEVLFLSDGNISAVISKKHILEINGNQKASLE